jgi:membrane protein YdbS with pleckstrin-like domain
MRGEVFLARADVEPLSLIDDNTADLAALPDPIRQDRNIRERASARNPLENRSRPDADAGEIISARVTVLICDVDDATALDRYITAVLRFAQGERYVIPGAKMFFEQRRQFDVREEIAAVGNEMLSAQQRFDILNPATRPQDFRLVDQLHGMTAIIFLGEKVPERFRTMMGVDNEGTNPGRDKVIQNKCDERFLENRDERFRQIFGERTQPHAETRAEDKGLRDHRRAVLVLRRHSDRTGSMAEETIWRGTASQLKNLGCFILCFLFCWLIVPIFIGFRRYLETKNQMFELTSERLKMTEGIFSKVTESLELYRVKDIEVLQPFIYRTVGLENIKVNTSDLSSPVILIDGISQKVGLADKLRNQVEIIRAQKNVRELDIE